MHPSQKAKASIGLKKGKSGCGNFFFLIMRRMATPTMRCCCRRALTQALLLLAQLGRLVDGITYHIGGTTTCYNGNTNEMSLQWESLHENTKTPYNQQDYDFLWTISSCPYTYDVDGQGIRTLHYLNRDNAFGWRAVDYGFKYKHMLKCKNAIQEDCFELVLQCPQCPLGTYSRNCHGVAFPDDPLPENSCQIYLIQLSPNSIFDGNTFYFY